MKKLGWFGNDLRRRKKLGLSQDLSSSNLETADIWSKLSMPNRSGLFGVIIIKRKHPVTTLIGAFSSKHKRIKQIKNMAEVKWL
jgi:hypothetical protein